jgi:hypothetical protein
MPSMYANNRDRRAGSVSDRSQRRTLLTRLTYPSDLGMWVRCLGMWLLPGPNYYVGKTTTTRVEVPRPERKLSNDGS